MPIVIHTFAKRVAKVAICSGSSHLRPRRNEIALWKESKRSVTEDEWLLALTGVNWSQHSSVLNTNVV